jgi:hypothetical protein
MPRAVTDIPAEFWAVVAEMAPYLLFGFLAAGALSVVVSAAAVERHLGGRGVWPVIKAAAFGIPLPLCSCGVIPVAASLRRHGASRGATTAFLVSTPQTGADSILVTFSLLGWVFAIYRPVAAPVSGVLGGAVVAATEKPRPAAADREQPPCTDACCADDGRGKLRKALTYGFVTLPRDIGRALLVGLVVAALISALFPSGYFSDLVPRGPLQILVLMAAGVPVYVCATASIPIAAGLIVAGVSPGAAFAFLMTGPATNAATIATTWKVLGRRPTAIYLAAMLLAAFAGGMVLDQFLTGEAVVAARHSAWMPTWVQYAAGVVLLAVLAVNAFYRPHPRADMGGDGAADALKLDIKGMTCSHCADTVRRALLSTPGVTAATVDLDAGTAVVRGEEFDAAALRKSVESVGYDVVDS